ncbi:PREDICTED: uncharacterized protein LOC108555389 [Eufriesea mexicana]|uniref:uncharacterized protein LOC108555389 n=1 Tax=Eufriesea mexicana TaxID=516756 RepID=UPI00083BCE86|nr:PREDICTED: uncharacterized protein LOC108555389 [Eufriesea mexicana]
MKATACSIYPLVRRRLRHRRASFLVCVLLLVVLSPVLVLTDDRGNERENTYPKEPEDSPEFAKNPKESKVSSVGEENKDSMVKSGGDQPIGQSAKAIHENSPALRRFLDDVLKAQDDLKWIDQTVGNVDRGRNSDK